MPSTMDQQQDPPEFILDVFSDPRSVRDVVKGILHTIFFTRFFPSLTPRTRDVLDLTLPYVDDDELETMIDQRASALERQLDAERSSASGAAATTANSHHPSSNGARGQLAVQFFEKRRRKAWLSRGDEEVCWECWTVKVTVAEPRTESERAKVRRAMEQTLLTTAMKIVTFANSHKDHIPPITTQGGNPFPFKINVDQKETGWAARMRIYG
ncbi:autophagy-related protein [Hirsutella rhossiliensis]|uniref:Autophagy-related protein 101 n=1 Tax=Hirsutella rhossiliensis TaxID=111463 RepID=A0A9P8MXI2_9HYPO|nr:autophagy-related protein [Hirsutella rhossiliensis]KAH0963055.1 autophagy-related protein [Hirsutella rhossiliensis]